jgi:hypothetical protein
MKRAAMMDHSFERELAELDDAVQVGAGGIFTGLHEVAPLNEAPAVTFGGSGDAAFLIGHRSGERARFRTIPFALSRAHTGSMTKPTRCRF